MAGWKILIWVGVVAITLWFLYMVRGVLFPFIVGLVIAVLLEPTVKKLRLKGISRGISVAFVFTVFFSVMVAVSIWAVPVISNQVAGFAGGINRVTQQFAAEGYRSNYFVRWNPKFRAQRSTEKDPVEVALVQVRPLLDRFGLPSTRSSIMEKYVEPNRPKIAKEVQRAMNGFLGVLSGVGGLVMMLPLIPLIVLFLLMDMDKIKARAPGWIPPVIRRPTMAIIGEVGDVFINYLRGITLSCILYTVACALVLSLVGAPFPVLLALVFGPIYLIPFFGGLFNYVVLFIVTIATGTTGNWFMNTGSSLTFGLVLVLVLFILTWGWDTFATPQFVGKAVGLSPLVGLFVVFCGGALFGVAGMFLSFPVGGAIKVILERLLRVTSSTGSDTIGLPTIPLRHRITES